MEDRYKKSFYELLLWQCCAKTMPDQRNKWNYLEPFEQDGFICASNSSIGVRIMADACGGIPIYGILDGAPDKFDAGYNPPLNTIMTAALKNGKKELWLDVKPIVRELVLDGTGLDTVELKDGAGRVEMTKGIWVEEKYLYLLALIPGIQFRTSKPTNPVLFRWEDGDAAIMPSTGG